MECHAIKLRTIFVTMARCLFHGCNVNCRAIHHTNRHVRTVESYNTYFRAEQSYIPILDFDVQGMPQVGSMCLSKTFENCGPIMKKRTKSNSRKNFTAICIILYSRMLLRQYSTKSNISLHTVKESYYIYFGLGFRG